jgi:hypothetical protein
VRAQLAAAEASVAQLRRAQAEAAEAPGLHAALQEARAQLVDMDRCEGAPGKTAVRTGPGRLAGDGPGAWGEGEPGWPSICESVTVAPPPPFRRVRSEARRVEALLQTALRERDAAREEMAEAGERLAALPGLRAALTQAQVAADEAERSRDEVRAALAAQGGAAEKLQTRLVSAC